MYCSQADVERVISRRTLLQLTSDSSAEYPPADDDGRVFSRPHVAEINADVIEDAIRSACELIDAYLRGRYDVVAVKASSPTVLRDLAVNIVRQKLYERRAEMDVPKSVEASYSATRQMLTDIKNGALTLGIAPEGKDMPDPGQIRVKSRPATLGGPGGWLEKF
ncbi:TPA: phage protein Gp36 family protein [Salmonella enterica]